MSDSADASLWELIEGYLAGEESATLTQFLDRIDKLVRRTFFRVRSGLPYETFRDWFPGWLFHEKKLVAVRNRLQREFTKDEILSGDADQFLKSYLVKVILSAIGDWRRQHKPLRTQPLPQNEPGRHETSHSDKEQVRFELFQLSQELRVPFWLRHSEALDTLPESDLDWIASLSGLTRQQIADAISSETQRVYPRGLSSEFIGQLLHLHCLSNGKYAAVDQRIRRARDEIQYRLCTRKESEPPR